MIKRVLAFTSSVLFAAGTTPWPAHSTHPTSLLPNAPGKAKTGPSKTSILQEGNPTNTMKTFSMSVDFFRETKRLQEIHYAVSKQSILPVWQDPNAFAYKQRIQQSKARLRPFTPKPTASTAPRKTPRLSSRSGSIVPDRIAEDTGLRIASVALSLVGTPYSWGGESEQGFDCSGLSQYVYRKAGIAIPRTSYEQFCIGTALNMHALQPGDLVFFSTTGAGPSHVAIFVGNGLIVQALNASSGVIVSHLSSSYYQRHFLGGRRVNV